MAGQSHNTPSERAESPLRIVILGLSITSSWGNGHAATYRGLVRALDERGHRVLFLERDVPWYAAHRDLPEPPYAKTFLYRDLDDLRRRFLAEVRSADVVIVGSYVPEGVRVGEFALRQARGLTAFYDIDTPVTLGKLRRQDYEYLTPELIAEYDLYLSFTGGPTLEVLEEEYDSPMARPLHCAVDRREYYPERSGRARDGYQWLMGYLGTYSDDRQPRVEALLNEAARRLGEQRFIVAGSSYPGDIDWPSNVERVDHLAPPQHRGFYNAQRFTLNVTRDDMIEAGYSPSVRLFEAAACATPIISDAWEGIETFFEPGEEILLAESTEQAVEYLTDIDDEQARQIGRRARQRVLAEHTPAHRAEQLEQYVERARGQSSPARAAQAKR